MTKRVAIYARISQDRAGEALGVDDQLERCHQHATTNGYTVVAEENDNDISAYTGKERPGYQRVLHLARAGAIDTVVVYHLSRWTRNREESAAFITEFSRLGVNVEEAQGMVYRLDTATGRFFAGFGGLSASFESDIKSERVKAAVERRAKTGRHVSHPGYGWVSTGTTSRERGYALHPEHAGIIREIARELVAGKSLSSIKERLNAAGIPAPGTFTPTGKIRKVRKKVLGKWITRVPTPDEYPKWSSMTIHQIMARKSNIGLVHHHPGQPDETTFSASWPPILDDATYAAVMRRLTVNRGKGAASTRIGKRVHLLTGGVAYCGVCRSPLTIAKRALESGNGVNVAYRCGAMSACVQRKEVHLDDFARDALIARLSRPDSLVWMQGDESEAAQAAEEVTALTQRMDELQDDYDAGFVSRDKMRQKQTALAAQIAAAKARRDAAARSLDVTLLRELAGPTARAAWDRLDVAQRRLALEAVGMRIEVLRSVPSGTPRKELDQSTVRLSFQPREEA